MNMVGLCCLSLPSDKFILPARYEPAELCKPLSAAAILQIHLVTEGSSTSSVCYMRTDIFQSSSHHHPSSSSRGPNTLPYLIMWARCLGVSVCHPFALSASIMPLSGRLANVAHSFCVCLWVQMWMLLSSTEFHSSPTGSFSHSIKPRLGRGWLL